MAPLALSENGRTKFTGNAGFYVYQYRYRPRAFLPRNINSVLEANEATRLRQLESPSRKSSGSPVENGTLTPHSSQRRQKTTIDQVLKSLRPENPILGSHDESRLRIDLKLLKWNPHPSPRQASPRQLRPIILRCQVQLKIWYLKNGTPSDEIDDKQLLFKESEMCTVEYQADTQSTPATLEMDDYFVIKAGKLFVLLPEEGRKQDFRFADGYRFELRFLRTDSASPWPPLVSDVPSLGDLGKVSLVTTIDTHGSRMPSKSEHKVYFCGSDGKRQRTNFSLEIDHKWASPPLAAQRPRVVTTQSRRLPTPISESRELEISNCQTTLTAYTFLTALENAKYHGWFGPPDTKGQHSFCVRGYSCAFCDGRQFPSSEILRFHFVTAHDLFHFKTRQRRPMPGLRSGDDSFDHILEVLVDLSKESVLPRASNDATDPRTWTWVKPTKHFDPQRFLKGDWSWLNERKGIAAMGYRRTGSADETPQPQAPKVIDWNNIPEVPRRTAQPFVVSKNKYDLPGKIYVRSRSKRYVDVGEALSESDDDVDEDWLIRKHEETICDFEDIAKCEHEFMKLWDRHMFEERIIALSHIGPSLYRFARKHRELLRNGPLLVEFWKHCLNQIQFRAIDTEVLRVVMELIKGGKDQWSSHGKTPFGIGLAGPLVLDDVVPIEHAVPSTPPPPTPSSTLAAHKLRSSTRRAKKIVVSDTMDIDGPPPVEVKTQERYAVRLTPMAGMEGYGICICSGPWLRSDMVRCDGLHCDTRWFHRSCMATDRWVRGWLCPQCSEAEGDDEQ